MVSMNPKRILKKVHETIKYLKGRNEDLKKHYIEEIGKHRETQILTD